MAVQVKRWGIKNNVSSPVVQQVRGSLGIHKQSLIITTSIRGFNLDKQLPAVVSRAL